MGFIQAKLVLSTYHCIDGLVIFVVIGNFDLEYKVILSFKACSTDMEAFVVEVLDTVEELTLALD